jgi:L-ribulose-5-phosphate 4-epimerase
VTKAIPALAALRREVLAANRALSSRGLAPFTFGNASGIDRKSGYVIIKPSGVPYDRLTAKDLVAVSLDGRVAPRSNRPSSDLATHLALYRAFSSIGGVAHAHSHYATAWAQAGREIPCFGTTHADHFHGPVPLVPHLSQRDVDSDYEANTGLAIVNRFAGLDPMHVPGALLAGHASFAWGASVTAAVDNIDVLETLAHLAYDTLMLDAAAAPIPDGLREKHFRRKHGAQAYYGQGGAGKPR